MIPISPNAGDIRNYLEMRLNRDPEPEAMNDGLRADIIGIDMCVGVPSIPTLPIIFTCYQLHIDSS